LHLADDDVRKHGQVRPASIGVCCAQPHDQKPHADVEREMLFKTGVAARFVFSRRTYICVTKPAPFGANWT
jgi:hypothetical protein